MYICYVYVRGLGDAHVCCETPRQYNMCGRLLPGSIAVHRPGIAVRPFSLQLFARPGPATSAALIMAMYHGW